MTRIRSEESKKNYFTQSELSERWGISPGTLIKWRNEGRLPFFRLPGVSKILYPVDQILECEQQHTITTKEVKNQKLNNLTEFKRKTPVVSTKSLKKWRI